ncbi:cation:dicarboxylate symporter family transporter, partial [Pseudomonas aeruginosa]
MLVGLSKGGLGGALALMGVPLMALAVSPVQAAAIFLPILIVMDIVALFAWRHYNHRETLLIMLPGAIAGIALGHFYPAFGEQLKPLGDGFIRLVKMIIAPVIFLTVATGIAGMNDMKKVGRVAGKAMIYFLVFSTLALIVGLIVANTVQPGAGMNIDPATLDAKAVATYADKAHEQTITGFLMNIIPTTIVGAFASGDILQVLFFSVLFGIALGIVGEKGKPVTDFMHALMYPIFKLVAILMKAAPIGAFGA